MKEITEKRYCLRGNDKMFVKGPLFLVVTYDESGPSIDYFDSIDVDVLYSSYYNKDFAELEKGKYLKLITDDYVPCCCDAGPFRSREDIIEDNIEVVEVEVTYKY